MVVRLYRFFRNLPLRLFNLEKSNSDFKLKNLILESRMSDLEDSLHSFIASEEVDRRLDALLHEIHTDFFYQATFQQSLVGEAFAKLFKVENNIPLTRLGRSHDGGYVVADIDYKESLVLSAGAGDDISFERQLCELGSNLILVDHTVELAPEIVVGIDFRRLKLVPNNLTKANFSVSIESLLSEFNQEFKIITLKLDIEGDEWVILEDLITNSESKIDFISQLVIEFHGLLSLDNDFLRSERFEKISRIVKKFNVVNLHANNYSTYVKHGNRVIPDVFEVTLLNKNFEFRPLSKNKQMTSAGCNRPNNPLRPDFTNVFDDVN